MNAQSPKKPSLWSRLFGRKKKASSTSSVLHKAYALEPYHQELSAPALARKKAPQPAKVTIPQPAVHSKETHRETLITNTQKSTPAPVDTPQPMGHQDQGKDKDKDKDKGMLGHTDAESSIVGNIMKQSAEHGGRKRRSGNTMDFKRPKVQDHKWLLNSLSYLMLFLVLLSIGGYLFFYIELDLKNNLAQDFLRRPSVGQVYENKQTQITELNEKILATRRELTKMEARLQELQPGNLTYNTLPFLQELKKVNDARVNWARAMEGIETTVAKAGGATDFLKQLTYQGFSFNNATKQVTLGSPTVRGVYYEPQTADVIGSSISLATQVLQMFEESAYFRDLKQLNYSRSEIDDADSEFGLYQNYQTPIVLNMIYQSDGEKDCRDKGNTCFGITTSPAPSGPVTTPSTPIQRQ